MVWGPLGTLAEFHGLECVGEVAGQIHPTMVRSTKIVIIATSMLLVVLIATAPLTVAPSAGEVIDTLAAAARPLALTTKAASSRKAAAVLAAAFGDRPAPSGFAEYVAQPPRSNQRSAENIFFAETKKLVLFIAHCSFDEPRA